MYDDPRRYMAAFGLSDSRLFAFITLGIVISAVRHTQLQQLESTSFSPVTTIPTPVPGNMHVGATRHHTLRHAGAHTTH